jgi:hypothetical protein
MKINTSVALKAGLIGAAAGLVLGIAFGLIPFLGGCLVQWGGSIIGLVTGALYVYLTPTKENVLEGALGGAVTGVVAGAVNALASNVLAFILQNGTILGLFLGVVSGAISGAVLGAIGGLVYSAIKK